MTHAGSTTGPEELLHGQLNYKDTSGAIKEAVYAGQTTVAVVGCNTCHDTAAENDPHLTGEDYEAGAFPLRVPTGADEYAMIEKSSAVGTSDGTQVGGYGVGNACMWCHKSRKDVTNYVTASNKITSTTWGPHNGPQTDVFSGKGAYEFPNKTYKDSSHTNLETGCVSCHMPAVADNLDVGDHSFYPALSVCKNCHGNNITDFNVGGGQGDTKIKLRSLRTKLNEMGLLTRNGTAPLTDSELADDNFADDDTRPQNYTTDPMDPPLTSVQAGALYNYLVMARGSAFGVHNPNYSEEILYDSIQAIGGDLTNISRP